MDASYVPPWRQRQSASGDSGDAPQAEHAPNNRYNNRANSGRGRGHRGSGRGGRGGYQRDFFQKQKPQVDESDLYHQRDIDNYFWSEERSTKFSHSSTFHDSKDRPDELSYLLLFFGANPRWVNDRIVFAKSKLTLLPEYAAKKAENGEWETEKKIHQGTRVANKSGEAGASEDKDATVAPDRGVTDTMNQDGGATSADAGTLSSPPIKNEKQKYGIDGPGAEEDTAITTIDTAAADSAAKEEESQVNQEYVQGGDNMLAEDSGAEAQGSKVPDKPDDDEPPKEDARHKKEEQHTNKGIEEDAENGRQETPIPTPSSTPSASRLKYTDIRLEEAQAAPALSPSTAPSGRMKYNDVRTIPAHEFYDELSPPEPVFPPIAPIDYVPSKLAPIAVFEERKIPGLRTSSFNSRFTFKGWFKISRVNILAPHSAELVRMLQQKWERRDRFGNVIPTRNRDPFAWNSSLAMEWAVIKFDLLEGEGAPPPPQIQKLPEPERPVGESGEARGVNEMLSDMRLNDGNVDMQKGQDLTQKDEDLTQKGEDLEEDVTVKPEENMTATGVSLVTPRV
ncbi:hypothetical protein HD806DRAFT_376871 [Xylariaceae sp. AK1471]|nr:hypothetical protein HD806DRAFT_376871 [Xylariaceae sp. AK1471]